MAPWRNSLAQQSFKLTGESAILSGATDQVSISGYTMIDEYLFGWRMYPLGNWYTLKESNDSVMIKITGPVDFSVPSKMPTVLCTLKNLYLDITIKGCYVSIDKIDRLLTEEEHAMCVLAEL